MKNYIKQYFIKHKPDIIYWLKCMREETFRAIWFAIMFFIVVKIITKF